MAGHSHRRPVARRKVPGVPGHEPVRPGGLGAFKEPIVGIVGRDGNGLGRLHEMSDLADGGHRRRDAHRQQAKSIGDCEANSLPRRSTSASEGIVGRIDGRTRLDPN